MDRLKMHYDLKAINWTLAPESGFQGNGLNNKLLIQSLSISASSNLSAKATNRSLIASPTSARLVIFGFTDKRLINVLR